MPQSQTSDLPQVIECSFHRDDRGWLSETYSAPVFEAKGINVAFVQDNHSHSFAAFTLRGLHCQAPPYGQDKLVRCTRGRIFDVAVDVRRGSPTYGNWTATELTSENGKQFFIPIGFAHGFLTLEPECEVHYKCSNIYSPKSERGIAWNSAGIDWPTPTDIAVKLSARDRALPALSDFDSPFRYMNTTPSDYR